MDSKKFVNELINCSKSDLESSKILYKSKKYSQSVFLFQQSVEKLNKALGLESLKIKESELKREINHFPIKIHEKIIGEQAKSTQNLISLREKYPSLNHLAKPKDVNETHNSTNNFLNLSKEIRKNPKKYIDLSEKNIDEYLDQIKSCLDEFKLYSPKNMKQDFSKNDIANLKKKMIRGVSSFYNEKPEAKALIEKTFDAITPHIDKFLDIFIVAMSIIYRPYMICLILSILTTPHTFTRYPMPDCSFIPDKIYTEKLPFVKKLPEMYEYQELAINDFKKSLGFFSNLKKDSKTK